MPWQDRSLGLLPVRRVQVLFVFVVLLFFVVFGLEVVVFVVL